jgi:hypothetical protein
MIMAGPIITGSPFIPIVGQTFEVAFGKITYQGKTDFWGARIRIDGLQPKDWYDIDAGGPLDPKLAAFVVQAYRQI